MYRILTSSVVYFFFFFNDTATTEIYTLSLHDALPISNLQGHVRAGAEVVLEALAAQSRPRPTPTATDTLEQVHQLWPGLGALAAVPLDAGGAVIGRTLAQVNLRGRTGATVLAITRADGGVLVPTAKERLRVGDVLAVAGTHEAIDAARAALLGRAPSGRAAE